METNDFEKDEWVLGRQPVQQWIRGDNESVLGLSWSVVKFMWRS